MSSFVIKPVGDGLGDCFFIELSNECWKNIIMVDGRDGTKNNNFDIEKAIELYISIDYLIVTHVDKDHINGVIKLIKSNPDKFSNTVIIYNYVTRSTISFSHAVKFEKLLSENCVIPTCRKDYSMYSSPCLKLLSYYKRCNFDIEDKQRSIACLTLIHPDKAGVDEVYDEYRRKYNIGKPYNSKLINRNSIAFIIEFMDKTVLFTGDCEFSLLVKKLENLWNFKNKKIDMIKIPHHGAKENCNELAKYSEIHNCKTFLLTGEKNWAKKKEHPSEKVLNELLGVFGDLVKIYTNIDLTEFEKKIGFTLTDKKLEILLV